ncbi:hypothetical protein [Streptomyces brasiliscabiei]|uniref:hypothetical protein n=1 Tax=Streptomyces brasiliscabiei TaxID=2736302 RepID=UPI0038F71F2C
MKRVPDAGSADPAGTRQPATPPGGAAHPCSSRPRADQGDPPIVPPFPSHPRQPSRQREHRSLAHEAAAHRPADVEQQWISLAAHPLPDVDDLRHGAGDPSRAEEGNHFGGVLRGIGTAPGDVLKDTVLEDTVLKDTEEPARAKTFFAQDALKKAGPHDRLAAPPRPHPHVHGLVLLEEAVTTRPHTDSRT